MVGSPSVASQLWEKMSSRQIVYQESARSIVDILLERLLGRNSFPGIAADPKLRCLGHFPNCGSTPFQILVLLGLTLGN